MMSAIARKALTVAAVAGFILPVAATTASAQILDRGDLCSYFYTHDDYVNFLRYRCDEVPNSPVLYNWTLRPLWFANHGYQNWGWFNDHGLNHWNNDWGRQNDRNDHRDHDHNSSRGSHSSSGTHHR